MDEPSRARHDRLPFWIPTPIKRGGFTPLDDEHGTLDVQTDLGAVRSFSLTEAELSPTEVLYADLQTNTDVNHGLRLGAGRSGFYRGRYLKGIGRTLLASNWNDAADAYHGTGHLCASAGARELLITAYLDALGCGDCITRCDGLLAKSLDPGVRGFLDALRASSANPRGAVVDGELMALTAKEGNFARMSNLTWLLDRAGLGTDSANLRQFFALLARFTRRPRHESMGDTTPQSLAGQLRTSFETTVSNFHRFFECGVVWCSLHNNFALDGRFVDLELPIVLGGPVAGAIEMGDYGQEVVGLEVLQFIQQFALWVRYVVVRLRFNAEILSTEEAAPFRAFAVALANAIENVFPPSHLVFSADEQVRLVRTWFKETLGLGASSQARLEDVARRYLQGKRRQDRLSPVSRPVQFGTHESGTQVRLLEIGGIAGPRLSDAALDRAAVWSEGTQRVDEARDVVTYLGAVGAMRSRLAGSSSLDASARPPRRSAEDHGIATVR